MTTGGRITDESRVDAELVGLHPLLLRFARHQLRNDGLADDVVSETLLAIMEQPDCFEGRSSLRTYATAILKLKIIDALRLHGRETNLAPLGDQTIDETVDAMFAAVGSWLTPKAGWPEPDQALESEQFMTVLQSCVERLPPRIGHAYMAREWLDQDVKEICGRMQVSSNNLGAMLYRARMRLRECLERNWFGKTE